MVVSLYMHDDLKGLLEACVLKDRKAWERFVNRFSGLLFFSAREALKRNGIYCRRHDIEDVVQIVFAELWEKGSLRELRDCGQVGGWLSIIAQRKALNYIMRRKERLLSEDESYRIENLYAMPPDRDSGLIKEFEAILNEFKPEEQILLKLYFLYNKKHREIAGITQLPINTVSTIIARRRKQIQRKLKKLKEKGTFACLI